MKRIAKITIICPIEIDDDVDVTNENELNEALSDAIGEDIFCTEYLSNWDELSFEDVGEWDELSFEDVGEWEE